MKENVKLQKENDMLTKTVRDYEAEISTKNKTSLDCQYQPPTQKINFMTITKKPKAGPWSLSKKKI